jgi:DnaJ-class molecular chaperone
MDKTIVRCHGCNGNGWVQVIDPPVYQLRDAGNTTTMPPRLMCGGTARAQACPLCGGAGGLIEGSLPPKPARLPKDGDVRSKNQG